MSWQEIIDVSGIVFAVVVAFVCGRIRGANAVYAKWNEYLESAIAARKGERWYETPPIDVVRKLIAEEKAADAKSDRERELLEEVAAASASWRDSECTPWEIREQAINRLVDAIDRLRTFRDSANAAAEGGA